jgi:hypothetical protein
MQRRGMDYHSIDFTAPNSQVAIWFGSSVLSSVKSYVLGWEIYSSAVEPTPAKVELWKLHYTNDINSPGSTFSPHVRVDPDYSIDCGVNIYYNQPTFTTADATSRKMKVWWWDQVSPLVYMPDPRFFLSFFRTSPGNNTLALLVKDNALFGNDIGGVVYTCDGNRV